MLLEDAPRARGAVTSAAGMGANGGANGGTNEVSHEDKSLLNGGTSLDEVKLEQLTSPIIPRSPQDYYKGSADVTTAGSLSKTKRYVERERLTPDANGIVLVLVGLPARGKSFISRKLEGFLEWRGLPTRVFNVGKYRREAVAPQESGRSNFFDAENKAALAAREAAALAALDDALAFLSRGGKVAILDATNSTMARRKLIADQVLAYGKPFAVVFVEAICDDGEILEANMLGKVQNSPDFWHLTLDDALSDLKARIGKYEDVYETVEDSEGPYIKVFDLSSKIMASHCYGRLANCILPFMMAIHIGARPIWLVRAGTGDADPQTPGESDRLSKLSNAGRSFALSLSEFVHSRSERYWSTTGKKKEPTCVLTSTLPRAVASVSYTTIHYEQTSALNPIDKGTMGAGWWDVECHGNAPPWEEVKKRHPEFYSSWQSDPFKKRFPGGESYMDLVKRLESVLIEVEMSTRPVLIVSHITVLQLLVAYFRGTPVEEAWKTSIPRDTVMEVSPTSGGGFVCEEHPLVPVPLRSHDYGMDMEPESPKGKRRVSCSPEEVIGHEPVDDNREREAGETKRLREQ
mmetsp:Transcript_134676/g.430193  ORF Transcript_134676/g.430193 Transcript_134676/m.430193 type:complete len:576 (+) Transcript_134676:68-1795(+)